jgi:hypothetical protein
MLKIRLIEALRLSKRLWINNSRLRNSVAWPKGKFTIDV